VKYRTIVVDPPWSYEDRLAGMPYERGASSQYGCMSLEAIKALPIPDWAEPDAHLYVWVTNGFMVEAHELVRHWGFQQKTIRIWIKPGIGLGHIYRNNTEHVLVATRGKLAPLRADVPTAFYGQRGRHSEKPHAFYDETESVSPGPYLDVFARKLRFNWDAWGLEVGAPDGLPTPQEVVAATQAGEED
jgi:N6-adenosine-specific RNA methylase IME4